MPFKNRWRITGRLTTATSLRGGNGETTTRPDLCDERLHRRIDITAVATDVQDQAYIPGKTLKGNLRAWLQKHRVAPAIVETTFGSDNPDADTAVGGKAEFWDACVVACPYPAPRVPYWDPQRLTGVSVSVAIDRRTRTAQPNKLFHQEFVPPGVSFEITVTGQDLEPEEMHLLLYVLDQFNHSEDPVVIGAETSDGQGRCIWELTELARLDKQDIVAWLQNSAAPVGYAGYPVLAAAARDALIAEAQQTFPTTMSPTLTLNLSVYMHGPFLVNDPSQTKKPQSSTEDNQDLPDHAPLRHPQGHVLLPASSIRGALRSQAEKIVRTLRLHAACRATHPDDACAPIYKSEERSTKLCLTCQLFGASGWRAPVACSDFAPIPGQPETSFHQEFLAIDRFTGGGAPGLKFDADAVFRPVLSGTLAVDLRRVDTWALGLLALTLRDLIEGDIPLGFGAAKGYGACRAAITGIRLVGPDVQSPHWSLLANNDATHIDFNQLDLTTQPPPDEVQFVIAEAIKAFHDKVDAFPHAAAPQGEIHAVS